ncbi:MAG: pyruvate kinase [Planctomycetes bacterium]|nr:pyruvate kinase [Planctomycetota bacterium]
MAGQRRKVKIIATLGPASSTPEILGEMMEAGMDAARLNCSHATHEGLAETAGLVRRIARQKARPVGLLLDLCGPKLRTGHLEGGGPVVLEPGAELVLSPDVEKGDASRVGVSYAGLAEDVRPGHSILIDDGLLELMVERVDGREMHCRVVIGGELNERKGINLPGSKLALPALTEKDLADLAVGIRLGVDFVALSFVQTANDVRQLRQAIEGLGADTPIIAKIERPQAIDELEAILESTDGVMVARGDLGVEAGAHRVPMLQKRILREASRRAVLDITATQMLDSMIRNPRPTRAEASDVANAILDGSDAVMLSGETAVGQWPVEAVAMMSLIALEVEAGLEEMDIATADDRLLSSGPAAAVARAACLIAQEARYRTIIVLTGSGWTARTVAAFAPHADIIALTPSERTFGRLTLVRGVRPVFLPFSGNTDEILSAGESELRRLGIVEPGEEAILVSGQLDSWGVTHLLKIFRVRDDQGPGDRASVKPRVAVTEMREMPRLDDI